ncbi:DUF3019 domain-containing protein [Pseudidiomarina sp. 1APP75-32.1]|uniref:DUF3019 domain-containing protein n=1 Tax=Pseudidiomarina terrestris TaxID=2820060 RepID=A0AAW7R398_9GAMM|nr:DUF3019 domain-containing protein [Pseudidiomarina sp. 1APP75-32.1]MDN7125685.1 DUF3019 domain-containing protein [Pseudidiomarina sp. 1APP75-32.1]
MIAIRWKTIRRLLISSGLLAFPLCVTAQEALKVLPATCVPEPSEELCHIVLQINFPRLLDDPSCLYAEENKLLICFPARSLIEYESQLSIRETTHFELRYESGETIAVGLTEFADIVKTTRRRRGIGWTIL